MAQLWGFGAPVTCAAGADTLPEPAGRSVGRALTGGAAAPGGTAEQPGPDPSAELLDGLTGAVPEVAADVLALEPAAAAGSIGRALQDLIRAGGLPLPGQRAAVPDAFAIASGLLGASADRARPAEAPAAGEERPVGMSGGSARTDDARPARPAGAPHGPAAPPPPPVAPDRPPRPGSGRPAPAGSGNGLPAGRSEGPAAGRERAAAAPAVPAAGGTAPVAGTAARTAAVTVAHDTAGTATAVLAPIAAGLLLTGAAMYKHRGLPKGH
ncbi:hypothetical protein [Kitasatospora sp. NPDC015120]|uniref:hypothetical protein n=1 Tax=Kitasatospora sp. NPDC015120 TaxID=3364023 RepID=UPI0036F49A63